MNGLDKLKSRLTEVQAKPTRGEYYRATKLPLQGSLRTAIRERPFGAPTLFQDKGTTDKKPVKLVISQQQAPGDILALTAAVRNIHLTYPYMFVTDVRTTHNDLFMHSPYIYPLDVRDPEVVVWEAEYPAIKSSNTLTQHFVHAFSDHFEQVTGLPLTRRQGRPIVYLMEDEKEEEVNPAYIEAKVSKNYWIIDAGRKNDYTTKLWDVSRYRDLVKLFPHVTFVQIGLEEHYHPALEGHNVVNLIGKTPGRTLLYLMYHAYGVITPVSYPMHLSAAVEANPIYGYKHRPTIVIAGGREPAAWEAYSTHQFLHKCGMLSCAREGGCWVSRVEKLNDNDPKDKNLCLQPVQTASGQVIPKCLDMIALQDVAEIMKQYMENIPLAKEVQSGN